MEVPPPPQSSSGLWSGSCGGAYCEFVSFQGVCKGLGEGFAEGPCVIIEGVFKQSCTGG